MNTAPLPSAPPPVRRGLRVAVLGLLVLGTVAVWIFREPLRNLILEEGLMLNNAPTESAIAQVIDQAKDRQAAIRAFWNTGKIVHREIAMRQLAGSIPPGQPIPAQVQSWVVGAALDPDMNVRETALSILRDHKDPALAAACAAEIRDIDPQARLLGLDNFKQVGASIGVPSLIPLLDDSDPLIVAKALKLLENWSGQTFGLKLYEAIPVENKTTGAMEYQQETRAKAKAAAAHATAWWSAHKSEFAPVHLEARSALAASPGRVRLGNFSLSTLQGGRISLSQLRGKVVLMNFWTTWCPACIAEMPELSKLQKSHDGRLVILGVSLDPVPDEDGDADGHDTGASHATNHAHAGDPSSLEEIRQKVARTVKARGIDYAIALDEKGDAGGRCNGGELPTTVILDAEGNVRRRFVGARSLAVLEAMIAQADQPLL